MAKTDKNHLEDFVRNYKAKFGGYSVEIQWPNQDEMNPDLYPVDIILKTIDGHMYYSTFLTKACLDYIFEKNKKTGECAGGTYFAMPYFVIVKEINNKTIKKTIDDMINNQEIESYFEEKD